MAHDAQHAVGHVEVGGVVPAHAAGGLAGVGLPRRAERVAVELVVVLQRPAVADGGLGVRALLRLDRRGVVRHHVAVALARRRRVVGRGRPLVGGAHGRDRDPRQRHDRRDRQRDDCAAPQPGRRRRVRAR